MHANSLKLMGELITHLRRMHHVGREPTPLAVLDVGAQSVDSKPTYRHLFPDDGTVDYRGYDASPGRNVDIVGDAYDIKIGWEPDLIISGQMLEHVTFPLLAVLEMKRVLRPGGWIILIAPWQWPEHKHPIDCWRILPDGMQFLLEGLEEISCGIREFDCFGMARKPFGYVPPWSIAKIADSRISDPKAFE